MILLLSLALLLAGTFLFKKIRLGALAAITVQVIATWSGNAWSPDRTSALIDGLIIALELGVLVFGALSFYQFLRINDRLAFLDHFVKTSPNRPYLLITYCMFLGSFFEGIAGFGIPPILLIPLLITSGFGAVTAIVCALCGSVTAVLFGALGAPLIIGLGIQQAGDTVNAIVAVNAVSFLVMPFIITYLYSRIERVEIAWRSQLPMMAGAGIIYCALFIIVSRFSVEYPSVVAGSVGMMLFMLVFNPLVRTWGMRFWLRSFWPYITLIVFLLLGKLQLHQYMVTMPDGSRSVSAYQPGIIFLFTILVIAVSLAAGRKPAQVLAALKLSGHRTAQSLFTILLLVTFAQLVRADMVSYLGTFIAAQARLYEPALLMSFGVVGAFLTGSATMSNLLLNGLLAGVASHIDVATAMLHTGSVLGNVVSLQNIVMAKSALDENISEYSILKYNTRALAMGMVSAGLGAILWLALQ